MGKDFVTPEQIEKARGIDLVDYLHKTEPGNIVHSAPDEYRLKDHDSLKISNGKFHWFSRGIGGTNAIDYLVKVRGMEFREAVRELTGDYVSLDEPTGKNSRPPPETKAPGQPRQPTVQDADRAFALPTPASHNNEVIEYLKGRGIEEKIIMDCIAKKLLYQSKAQNCVFVGYDGNKTPKFACERGINSDYKKDIAGSRKAFGFHMPPVTENLHGHGNSGPQSKENRLYVFEGPVDCMSHATIATIGGTDWDGHRLSLGGVSSKALNTFLENNPHVSQVYLCLDNDGRGNEASERISNELLSKEDYSHISIYIAPPPDGFGKDFNDTLMYMRETN